MTLEKKYDEKYYNYYDNIDDDDEVIEIPQDMFDFDDKFTAITTTEDEEVCTTSEDELCTTTTTGEEEEEEVRNTSDNATIDDKFTTSTTTTEEEDENSNNYYDNIDNKILRTEYEGTIVFEDDSLALTTVSTTTKPNDTIIKDLSTTVKVDTTELLLTVIDRLKENTLEYIYGMLSKNPYDDNTRETVCEILMEALSAQDDIFVDGAVVCNSLFVLFDINKQQQQRDTTSANNLSIVISTNTKIRPPKTSTPMNTNMHTNTNNKKKKKKKALPPINEAPGKR